MSVGSFSLHGLATVHFTFAKIRIISHSHVVDRVCVFFNGFGQILDQFLGRSCLDLLAVTVP